METITINLDYTQEQFKEAYQFHYRKTLHPERGIILGTLLLLYGIYTIVTKGSSSSNFILILLPLLLLLLIAFVYFILPVIFYRNNERIREPFRLVLTDETIFVTVKDGKSELKWSFFKDFRSNNEFILLYQTKKKFSILPKAAFSNPDEFETFKQQLASKIPNK